MKNFMIEHKDAVGCVIGANPYRKNASVEKQKKTMIEKKGGGVVIMIKYYLFCIRWLWKNRTWSDTRQKYKAMNKAWNKRSKRNGRRKRMNDEEIIKALGWDDYE